jgi:subtilisin family serine protease
MKWETLKAWVPFPMLTCWVVGLLALAISAAGQVAPTEGSGDNQMEWRFTIKADRVAPSTLTAENECRRRHQLAIDVATLPPFLHLMGEATFAVEPRSQHAVPVKFDTRGLKAGEYQGLVVIKCVTCNTEPGCTQDRKLVHVYMTVRSPSNEAFVPDRVLVLLSLDSTADVDATAKKLAANYEMNVMETVPLDSLRAAMVVYALKPGSDVLAKVAELLPEVQSAQPDYIYRTAGTPQESLGKLQYGRRMIHADQLGPSLTGMGVTLAIVDTGIDSAHPALKGRISGTMDVTGMGFTPDIHGTLLAGIIGGDDMRGTGILGIAPAAAILAVKACQPHAVQDVEAQCWSRTLAKGLDYVIQKKANVINLSLGGPADQLVERLIDLAVDHGIALVAAAGNDGPQGQPSFPAALPRVISVTAVDAKEQLFLAATQGNFVQVAAPGVDIVSTAPGGNLMVSSGTSLAAAFVSGAAALLLQQQPQLTPAALQSLLQNTAKHLGSPGKDPQFGSGLIDACRAATQLGAVGISCH